MARQKKEPNRVDELLDELLADDHSPEAILGENGLLKQLSKDCDSGCPLFQGFHPVSMRVEFLATAIPDSRKIVA
jgi:hypothetical protein